MPKDPRLLFVTEDGYILRLVRTDTGFEFTDGDMSWEASITMLPLDATMNVPIAGTLTASGGEAIMRVIPTDEGVEEDWLQGWNTFN